MEKPSASSAVRNEAMPHVPREDVRLPLPDVRAIVRSRDQEGRYRLRPHPMGCEPVAPHLGASFAMITVTLPLRLVSEANVRDGWAKKAKRTQEQRAIVGWALARYRATLRAMAPPITITLTRISPGRLDGDNLQRAAKGIRDQVASALGIDDGDARLEWVYAQRKGKPKEYGVTIAVQGGGSDEG
jgi:hypothetical protein